MQEKVIRKDAKGRFLPGSVPNPKGRPRDGESWTGLLRDIGNRTGKTGLQLKEEVLLTLYARARGGDIRACEVLLDRVEGKAVARIEQKFEDLTPRAKISFRKSGGEEVIDIEPAKPIGIEQAAHATEEQNRAT